MAEEKIKSVLVQAKEKLTSLGLAEELVSEIEWCLGSYAHDGNPEGLYVKAEEAMNVLAEYKKSNTRKVSKKLIDDLTKAIKAK